MDIGLSELEVQRLQFYIILNLKTIIKHCNRKTIIKEADSIINEYD